MFFIPIYLSIDEKRTILLDHLMTLIQSIPHYKEVYGFANFFGVFYPFVKSTWKSSKIKIFFLYINILSIPFLIMVIFGIGPQGFLTDDMPPFIFSKEVVPVTTIVPVGSVFLTFIISYGLMEFV